MEKKVEKKELKVSAEMLPELADFFKLLGEPVRLQLLCSVCHGGDGTVGELTERLGLCQSVVSRHMKMLHEGGLVERKQEGTRSVYSVPDDTLCRLCALASGKILAKAGRYSKLMGR